MSSHKFQFSGLARPSLRGRSQSDHCSCVSSAERGPYVRRPCARRVLRGCWEDTGWPALVRWLDGAVHGETHRGGAGADENPRGLFWAVHQVGSRRRESEVLCMAEEEQGRKKTQQRWNRVKEEPFVVCLGMSWRSFPRSPWGGTWAWMAAFAAAEIIFCCWFYMRAKSDIRKNCDQKRETF